MVWYVCRHSICLGIQEYDDQPCERQTLRVGGTGRSEAHANYLGTGVSDMRGESCLGCGMWM